MFAVRNHTHWKSFFFYHQLTSRRKEMYCVLAQTGGDCVKVWGIMTHFGKLSTNFLKTKACLNIADPAHHFMTTECYSSDVYLQQHNTTCHKAQIDFLNMTLTPCMNFWMCTTENEGGTCEGKRRFNPVPVRWTKRVASESVSYLQIRHIIINHKIMNTEEWS